MSVISFVAALAGARIPSRPGAGQPRRRIALDTAGAFPESASGYRHERPHRIVNGAQALVEVLARHGVEHLFCSPGSEWPPLWEELARRQAASEPAPAYLNIRHEILAVSMAAGYHKATGRLPAVLLHTTVGVLSGAMALRAARHEEIPMLVCAGESIAFGEDGFEPGAQWLRYLADPGGPARLAEPVVKWTFGVNTPVVLPSAIQRACRMAMTPPRGPVLVSLPFEHLAGPVPPPPVAGYGFPAPAVPEPGAIDAAAEALVAARSPVIVAETAGRDPAAVDTLVALAEALAAPVVEGQAQTYLNFPRDHALHGGFDARPHLGGADLVLLAGAPGPWHPASAGPPRGRVLALGADVLRADLPYWGYRVDAALAGDLTATLAALLDRVRARVGPGDPARRERSRRLAAESAARRQAWRAEADAVAERKPIDPRHLCRVLDEVLPGDAVVVEETITHRSAIARALSRARRGHYFGGQSGGLGVGTGLALGVACAHPDRPVVLLIGDGSFTYNPVLAALGFCREYDRPFLTVVFNNGGYLSMKRGIPALFPDGWSVRTGTYLGAAIAPSPRYAALAQAFDAHGETVDDPAEVAAALRRALEAVRAGRPAVLDVILAGDAR
jgi:thiamine pyrophosphate-dependent acetolactate synthase large subunit-like protein